MRAALHRRHGGLDVLELVQVPDPVCGPGDVLVAVRATAVNRLDVLQRQGPPLVPGFTLPHIAGMDIAGEVVALGSEVVSTDGAPAVGHRVVLNPAVRCERCDACRRGEDMFCTQSRVLGANRPGGYAELVAVPATHAHRVPDHIDDAEAATIPTIYATAWNGLLTTGDLRLGETVMIHAAGSGVSTAAIQLAKRAGATVVATAGSERKLALAKRLGADVVVNNRTGDVVSAAKEVTGGDGVDMVFDHVGPALFQASLRALRPGGRLVFSGATTGVDAAFNLPYAYHFGLRLLGAPSHSFREFGVMLDYYWQAGFEPVIDAELPLERVAEAQDRLDRGDVAGKLVLRP
jgi:NADPH:quinone reductase-like Zn-dependent oxidoreductase